MDGSLIEDGGYNVIVTIVKLHVYQKRLNMLHSSESENERCRE